MRNARAVIDWPTLGPRALAWLRAEVPQRHTLRNILVDCEAALGARLRHGRLSDWLNQSATLRAEWVAIKRTLGTGDATGTGPYAPTGASASSSLVPGGPSLDDFMLAKRREGCKICALPEDIRQMLTAGAKKYTRPELIDWLDKGHGVVLTVADFTAHAGRH